MLHHHFSPFSTWSEFHAAPIGRILSIDVMSCDTDIAPSSHALLILGLKILTRSKELKVGETESV